MSKGNSRIGAYKNTSGAQMHRQQSLNDKKSLISKDRLKHSTVGDFKQVKNDKWIITGGGHSQESIDFMNKHNIDYEINLIYENGVKVGNIFCNKVKKKASGNGQSWFPKNWTKEKIKQAGNSIAQKVLSGQIQKNDKDKYFDFYDGVIVGIFLKDGKAKTIFPDSKQQGAIKYERRKI